MVAKNRKCRSVQLATGILVIVSLLAACSTMPASGDSQATADALNYEGLQTVPARRMDIVQLRPGVDFSGYDTVLLTSPEIAYRTPDRSRQEFPLSQEQKDAFAALVNDVFASELDRMTSLGLADGPGPGVLRVAARLQDVTATIPPRSAAPAGRASIALRAVGDVTLVIELSDSRSHEILARAVDTKAIEGVAIASDGALVTRWDDVERIVRRWAVITRQGLEELLGR
jgi:hypothetical protein